MKKILIFHISQFGGHRKASENIKEALILKEPNLEVINLNGFAYLSPYVEKFVDSIYTLAIKYFPPLWGKIYDKKKVIKTITPFTKLINLIAAPKFLSLIKKIKPAVIIATQAFPCGIIAELKKNRWINVPLIGVVTDYYPHRLWIHQEVDIYTVACQEAKDVLTTEGVNPEKVKILGIPISVNFLKVYDKKELAKKFGFSLNTNTILLMGGGLGIGPIKKIAKVLDDVEEKFQLIVICGKNKKLFNWFKKRVKYFKKRLFYFGYIDFVDKLMGFSDIIITKAGGLTISEALAKGMATIVVNPIPGQEERNVEYLERKKAILKTNSVKEIGDLVKTLLRDRNELFSLKRNALQNATIDSSLRIVNLVLSYLN
ncbi:MAG: glycosyltransferase [Candidatus Omnitrophica bacterium]|nr:glycosyltransferase [Candidatus Omnitrophota bacterium]